MYKCKKCINVFKSVIPRSGYKARSGTTVKNMVKKRRQYIKKHENKVKIDNEVNTDRSENTPIYEIEKNISSVNKDDIKNINFEPENINYEPYINNSSHFDNIFDEHFNVNYNDY